MSNISIIPNTTSITPITSNTTSITPITPNTTNATNATITTIISQNTNYLLIFGCVIIIVLIIICLWNTYKLDIKKYFILKTLSNIKNASLTLIRDDGSIIFQKNDASDFPNKKQYKATITIHDEEKFFNSVADRGEIGIGETYANGIWDVDDLYSLVMIMVANRHNLDKNPQLYESYTSTDIDYDNVQHHYDIGNDFYDVFLDTALKAYSCGFFLCPSDTLDSAQYNKINMIIRKLGIKKGDKILDIGCGWGSLSDYVNKKTNCQIDGITLAKEQAKYIKDNYPNVNVMIKHYEHLDDKNKYDKIYSIGMIEHIRAKHYNTFFSKLWNIMNYGGRCVIHSITSTEHGTTPETGATKSFVTEHIFPGSQIGKIEWIVDAIKQNGFKLIHIEMLGGHHYAKTLKAWRINLMNNINLLKKRGYNDHLIRTYEYYFAICEALFLNDELQLSQFVFDKVDDLSSVSNSALCSNK